MTDWKKKIGFIVPSWNTVMEYECQRMAPAGVSVHFTRIAHTDDEEETLLHMIEVVPELADLLGHASLDAICFGCTGGSFVRPGMDEDIIGVIRGANGGSRHHDLHRPGRGHARDGRRQSSARLALSPMAER